MTESDFDWMVSNHAVWGWKAPVKTSVSGVSLLSSLSFSLPSFPFSPETPDTQATHALPTRQDGVENCDKVYCKVKITLYSYPFEKLNSTVYFIEISDNK